VVAAVPLRKHSSKVNSLLATSSLAPNLLPERRHPLTPRTRLTREVTVCGPAARAVPDAVWGAFELTAGPSLLIPELACYTVSNLKPLELFIFPLAYLEDAEVEVKKIS